MIDRFFDIYSDFVNAIPFFGPQRKCVLLPSLHISREGVFGQNGIPFSFTENHTLYFQFVF